MLRCPGTPGFWAGYSKGYSAAASKVRSHERAGEIALAGFICGAIVYELMFDDLLSMATERWCRKRPVLTRLVIGAVAGHLACALPHHIDVFSADNIIHRGIVWAIREVRR